MSDPVPAELLEIVDALLPGAPLNAARLAGGGNIHHVVLLPGLAAVRVSRKPRAAEALPRRTALLRAIGTAGLPFAVPEPLTPVTTFGERAAVAVSWLDGAGLPEGEGDPVRIGELLRALRELPLTPELATLLDAPRAAAGTRRWSDVLAEEVLPRLPLKWHDQARRRLDAAMALEPVPDTLIHGDLGAENVHWAADGTLIGVLDWDLAQLFDPAVDAALMAWHGWENIRRAVDTGTYRRARVWEAAFGVGHLVAVLSGQPLSNVDSYVEHVVAWLEDDAAAA